MKIRSHVGRPLAAEFAAEHRAQARFLQSDTAGRDRTEARRGFSLIELLAALTILMIIVSVVGLVFTESNRAWNAGTGRTINSIAGRAALQLVEDDLQYAVADTTLTFRVAIERVASGRLAYGCTNSELCFVSLEHDSSGDAPRTAKEVHYYMNEEQIDLPSGRRAKRFYLRKGVFTTEIADVSSGDYLKHCYHNPLWYETTGNGGAGRPSAGGVVAENVAGFSVRAYYNGVELPVYASASYSNSLPDYVDILIQILDERDALKAAQIAETLCAGNYAHVRVKDFVDRNAKRYMTRVYFEDRVGYLNR